MRKNLYKNILLLVLCLFVSVAIINCDSDDDEDKYTDLAGTSWNFIITLQSNTTYTGTFSISGQDQGSINGFGMIEIAYVDADFSLDGSIDSNDNMNMFFNLTDPKWVDITIHTCKYQNNTIEGKAECSNWNNATFRAYKQ